MTTPAVGAVGKGPAYYTIAASFLGAAAGGAWLGLVLMSIAGLYGNIPLWKDLLAGTLAAAVVPHSLFSAAGRQADRQADRQAGERASR